MSTRLDPASFAMAVLVESSDIPPDMTLAEWRAQRRATSPRVWHDRRARVLRRRLRRMR
jgi:hypothetical protein